MRIEIPVPDDLRARLDAEAALRGMTLEEYVIQRLETSAAAHTTEPDPE